MRIMRADEEQYDWNTQEEFLRRRVLISIVNLLPEVEIVVGPGIEFEGYTSNPMKHNVGSGHICDIGQRPRCFL